MSELNITRAQDRLLRAIGAPPDHTGLRHALQLASLALGAAAGTGSAIATAWSCHADALLDIMSKQVESQLAMRLKSRPLAPDPNYAIFYEWKKANADLPHAQRVLQALGFAIVAAATAQTNVPHKFLGKAASLLRDNSGLRGAQWELIRDAFPLCAATAGSLKQELKGEPHAFIDDLHRILSARLEMPPIEAVPADDRDSRTFAPEVTDARPVGPSSPPDHSVRTEPAEDPLGAGPAEDEADTGIAARLKAALFEAPGGKLGLELQWDRLSPSALRSHVGKLLLAVDSEPTLVSFALLTLVTATPPKAAIGLPLAVTQHADIYLDVHAGVVSWNYESYARATSSGSSALSAECEPRWVPIWLPERLAYLLRECLSLRPHATTVGELLGISEASLKSFGKFLRRHGDPAFRRYNARFARSMGLAYLTATNSDMAAAMLGLNFAAAAPSSLRYFAPTRQWIHDRNRDVYKYLSLGSPTALTDPLTRVGSTRALSLAQAHAGWSQLMSEIDRLTHDFFAASNHPTILTLASEINTRLLVALNLSTASRGSMPERHTWTSLRAHEQCISVNDKQGDARPRPIPRISPVRLVVNLLARVACKAVKSVQAITGSPLPLNPTDPAFVEYILDSAGTVNARPLTSTIGTEYMRRLFDADLNSGRHTWVTDLGEAMVNRWLIRALSGHGTDLTTPHGAQCDVPVAEMMFELGQVMETQFPKVFGDALFSEHADQPMLPWQHGLSVQTLMQTPKRPPRGVNSPNGLLRSVTPDVLQDASIGDEVRLRLLRDASDLQAHARLLLALIFFTPIPSVGAASAIAFDPRPCLAIVGKTVGVSVHLDYFLHPLWFPLPAPPLAVLARVLACPSRPASPAAIIGEAAAWLRQHWPTGEVRVPISDLELLARLADSWRRFNLPPSLHALIHPAACPPVFSLHSLHRLGDHAVGHPIDRPQELPDAGRYLTRHKRGADLGEITTILGRHARTDAQLGSKHRRAKAARDELLRAEPKFSPLAGSISQLYRAELLDTMGGVSNCLKVSSLATYNSTLMIGFAVMDPSTPVEEYLPEDWETFVAAVRKHIERPSARSGSDGGDWVRGKDAIRRFWLRLSFTSAVFDRSLFALLGDDRGPSPRSSASSSIILNVDVAYVRETIQRCFADRPFSRQLLEARWLLVTEASTRTEEVGAIAIDAITAHGSVLLQPNGFGADKSTAATRHILPSAATIQLLRQCAAQVLRIDPGTTSLFRCSLASVNASFEAHTAFLLDAIKSATGDQAACLHAVRAYSLQQSTWPDWQNLSCQLLRGDAMTNSAAAWSKQRFNLAHITLSREQAALAGHAGLQSSHGHYLSAWPLVSSIYLQGLLTRLDGNMAPLVATAGVSPDTLRQARHRARQQGLVFDQWQWLTNKMGASVNAMLPTTESPTADSVTANVNPSPADAAALAPRGPSVQSRSPIAAEASRADLIRYSLLRLLGVEHSVASSRTGLPRSVADGIDRHLPPDLALLRARTKVKQPGTRSLKADVERACGADAEVVLAWLSRLEPKARLDLLALTVRDKSHFGTQVWRVKERAFWGPVVSSMPPLFALKVRFGVSTLIAADFLQLGDLQPALQLGSPDRDLGAIPRIALVRRGESENRVTEARDTTLLRLACHALHVVERWTVSKGGVPA